MGRKVRPMRDVTRRDLGKEGMVTHLVIREEQL
jgi:hypothetical protein